MNTGEPSYEHADEIIKRNQAIPEAVLVALEVVRASGVTNMYDSTAVINEMLSVDEDDDWQAREASLWLEEHDDRYMEALKAMEERRG